MSGAFIGGVIGAVIGYFIPPVGIALGFAIGSTVGGILFPGHLPDAQGPRITDLHVQTSTYGTMLPILYGRNRVAGNVIWITDLQESSHEQDQGGKGGPTQSVTTYTYSVSAAISLCEGPIIGVRRIWADGTLIYDLSITSNITVVPYVNAGDIKVYLGDETQLPDPTIESHLGVGNVSAFRGQAYVVFTNFQLEKFGNRLPTFTFEVLSAGAPASQITDFLHPDASDGGNGYLYTDWCYNPLLNEIWALGNGYSPTSRYVNPIIRINPDTGALVGTLRWSDSLPDSGEYGQAQEICYNPFDKGVYLSLGDTQPTTSVCKLDAATGAVIKNVAGVRYYLAQVNVYDGTVWYGDIGTPSKLYQLNNDLSVKATFTTGMVGVGPMTFAANGAVFATEYNHPFRLWSYLTTGTFQPLWPGNFSYLSSAWYAADMAYDASRNCLWVLAHNSINIGSATLQYLFQFDLLGDLLSATQVGSSGTLIFDAIMQGIFGGNPDEKFYDPTEDMFWLLKTSSPGSATNGRIRGLRASDFSIVVDIAAAVDPGYFTAVCNHNKPGTLYFPGYDSTLINYLVPAKLLYGRLMPGTVYLADILTDIAERAGLASSAIDVSGQAATVVDGYAVTRQSSARACVEQLQQAYFVDAVESDWLVKFVNRGQAVAVVIQEDDLAAYSWGGSLPDDVKATRVQEVDLPQALDVVYVNEATDYQQGDQQSRRLVGASGQPTAVQVPIVMSDDKAKQLADALLFAAWIGRTTYEFSTSLKYAAYEPTDVVQIGDKVMRITERQEQQGILSWKGMAEQAEVYTQAPQGVATNYTSQSIASLAQTDLQLLDIPMLRDADNDAGFYAAACGYGAGWTGTVLFKSSDNGASYGQLAALTVPAAIGVTTSTLGSFSGGNIFDYQNSVTVLFVNGSASSQSELAVLNGAGAYLIGNEIVQAKSAVLNSDGSYTLSGLLRGRKGSEWAMVTHGLGERVIGLSAATLARISATSAEIGLARLYKGVTLGDSLPNTAAQSFTDTAVALKPYAPVQLTGSRDGSHNLTVNWIRRTRIGGEWRDLVDVPIGETAELYDVEVWDSGYTTLKRTFSGLTSATASYTAAQQTSDFGSTQSTVYLRVYQLSAVVGRGTKLEGSV